MKKWLCILPISGIASITVEADTAEDAMNMAVEQITINHVDDWDVVSRRGTVEEVSDD